MFFKLAGNKKYLFFYIFPSAHSYTLKTDELSFSEALAPIYDAQNVIKQNVIRIFTAVRNLIRLCPYMLHSLSFIIFFIVLPCMLLTT
jgi:hypothetical protein